MEHHFYITANKPVSAAFRDLGVQTFAAAADYVRQIPYGRNRDKTAITAVLTEGVGTCSTKHALLRTLAIEQGAEFVQLQLGIFRMNSRNTPKVADILQQHGLDYIPEAHCYLQVSGTILDCTHAHSAAADFEADLLETKWIDAGWISNSKIAYHRAFLENWLRQQPEVPYTLDELFAIRESCIAILSKQKV